MTFDAIQKNKKRKKFKEEFLNSNKLKLFERHKLDRTRNIKKIH